jgi:hypothetical protein
LSFPRLALHWPFLGKQSRLVPFHSGTPGLALEPARPAKCAMALIPKTYTLQVMIP